MVKQGLLLLAACLALLAPSAAAASTDERARAVIRISRLSPLVVAGERFRPVERIVITVRVGADTLVRHQRASRRGSFAARFAETSVDRCSEGLAVVVTGARGSVAKVRMPPRYCPPAIP